MVEITGNHNTAKIYTNNLEPSAEGQIRTICNMEIFNDSKIRIMPDVHAGKGCTIGTTMTIGDYIVPNMVGVDIGCGMLTVRLKEKRINLPELDSFIRKNVPHGRDVRKRTHRSHGRIDIYDLRCIKKVDVRRAKESLGTLGGGNHFIEVDTDGENLYLVIHSGSRNLGKKIAEYYQKRPIMLWEEESKRKCHMNWLMLQELIKMIIWRIWNLCRGSRLSIGISSKK